MSSQAMLAVAIAFGGDPFVGAMVAAVLAVCGLAPISAAVIQVRGNPRLRSGPLHRGDTPAR